MGQKTAEALQDVNLTEWLAGLTGPQVLVSTSTYGGQRWKIKKTGTFRIGLVNAHDQTLQAIRT